ncbi:MAG: hypothetical protein ACRD0U_04290, partial [Acidimicrobiales bacterium]
FHLDATPFLRPPDRRGGWAPTPPGWETRAVGVFEGPPREIVFDPARHDIVIAPPGTFAGREEQLENSGWWRVGQWSGGEVWGRHRTGATPSRALLHRTNPGGRHRNPGGELSMAPTNGEPRVLTPNQAVAANLPRLRQQQGGTQAQAAERLTAVSAQAWTAATLGCQPSLTRLTREGGSLGR